jgi:hypothetical protein
MEKNPTNTTSLATATTTAGATSTSKVRIVAYPLDKTKPVTAKVPHQRPKLSPNEREQNRLQVKNHFAHLHGLEVATFSDDEFNKAIEEWLTFEWLPEGRDPPGIVKDVNLFLNPIRRKFKSEEEFWDVPFELFCSEYITPLVTVMYVAGLKSFFEDAIDADGAVNLYKCTWSLMKELLRFELEVRVDGAPKYFDTAKVNIDAFMFDRPTVQLCCHSSEKQQGTYFQVFLASFEVETTLVDANFTFDDSFDHVVILLSKALMSSNDFVRAFKDAILHKALKTMMTIYFLDEPQFNFESIDKILLEEKGDYRQRFRDLMNELGEQETVENMEMRDWINMGLYQNVIEISLYPYITARNAMEVENFRSQYGRKVFNIPGRRLRTEEPELPRNAFHLLHQTKMEKFDTVVLKMCNNCLKKFERNLELCGRCQNVRYCCKECQVQDWKNRHKSECKPA